MGRHEGVKGGSLRIVAAIVIMASLTGCVTKIENTYYVQGDSNQIKATDSASATPTNRDLVDVVGSGYGAATQGGK